MKSAFLIWELRMAVKNSTEKTFFPQKSACRTGAA